VRVLPDVAASLDCWLWSTRSHLRDGAAALVFDSLTAALSEHARTVGRAGTTDPLVYPLKSMAA
jgi:hypothetical protein